MVSKRKVQVWKILRYAYVILLTYGAFGAILMTVGALVLELTGAEFGLLVFAMLMIGVCVVIVASGSLASWLSGSFFKKTLANVEVLADRMSMLNEGVVSFDTPDWRVERNALLKQDWLNSVNQQKIENNTVVAALAVFGLAVMATNLSDGALGWVMRPLARVATVLLSLGVGVALALAVIEVLLWAVSAVLLNRYVPYRCRKNQRLY